MSFMLITSNTVVNLIINANTNNNNNVNNNNNNNDNNDNNNNNMNMNMNTRRRRRGIVEGEDDIVEEEEFMGNLYIEEDDDNPFSDFVLYDLVTQVLVFCLTGTHFCLCQLSLVVSITGLARPG